VRPDGSDGAADLGWEIRAFRDGRVTHLASSLVSLG
jgi:hypothetical protein